MKTLENFIDYCDEMQIGDIATESTASIIKTYHENVEKILEIMYKIEITEDFKEIQSLLITAKKIVSNTIMMIGKDRMDESDIERIIKVNSVKAIAQAANKGTDTIRTVINTTNAQVGLNGATISSPNSTTNVTTDMYTDANAKRMNAMIDNLDEGAKDIKKELIYILKNILDNIEWEIDSIQYYLDKDWKNKKSIFGKRHAKKRAARKERYERASISSLSDAVQADIQHGYEIY